MFSEDTYSGQGTSRFKNSPSKDYNPKAVFKTKVDQINSRKLKRDRVKSIYKVVEPGSSDEENGPELFIAQPTDDIPRNKLVEKLARGLQAYI